MLTQTLCNVRRLAASHTQCSGTYSLQQSKVKISTRFLGVLVCQDVNLDH